jgi:DNA-directed RNA polymerase subunit RPC12/RpoP
MLSQKISKRGVQTPGGLACPKCGSTQFKAKRSAGAKLLGALTLGLGALLAPKTRVRCVACGREYVRG